MNNQVEKFKVVTGAKTVINFPNVFEPQSINGGVPKYSACLIFPKSDQRTISSINTAIKNAYEAIADNPAAGVVVPPFESIISPIKDGDIEFPQNHLYRNSYFINANSKFPPGIVDISLEPITDPKKVCSGMYCRASISFYFYNHEDRYGIGCTLNGLQLLQGGVSTAASEFADFKDIADDLF